MSDIVTHVSETSGYTVNSVEYPHIEILNANDSFAVLVTCLEEGDIPIYIEYNGNTHKLKNKVSPNPVSLSKLLRVYNINLCISPSEKHVIHDIHELLDLGVWW